MTHSINRLPVAAVIAAAALLSSCGAHGPKYAKAYPGDELPPEALARVAGGDGIRDVMADGEMLPRGSYWELRPGKHTMSARYYSVSVKEDNSGMGATVTLQKGLDRTGRPYKAYIRETTTGERMQIDVWLCAGVEYEIVANLDREQGNWSPCSNVPGLQCPQGNWSPRMAETSDSRRRRGAETFHSARQRGVGAKEFFESLHDPMKSESQCPPPPKPSKQPEPRPPPTVTTPQP